MVEVIRCRSTNQWWANSHANWGHCWKPRGKHYGLCRRWNLDWSMEVLKQSSDELKPLVSIQDLSSTFKTQHTMTCHNLPHCLFLPPPFENQKPWMTLFYFCVTEAPAHLFIITVGTGCDAIYSGAGIICQEVKPERLSVSMPACSFFLYGYFFAKNLGH